MWYGSTAGLSQYGVRFLFAASDRYRHPATGGSVVPLDWDDRPSSPISENAAERVVLKIVPEKMMRRGRRKRAGRY
jgi:hypothetical protein